MKRLIIGFVGLLLLMIVTVLVLRWWAMDTESGSQFILKQATASGLMIGTQSGTLNDGIRLGNVRYQTPTMQLQAQQLQVKAQLNLLPWPNLHIQQLQLDNVDVVLSDSNAQATADQGTQHTDIFNLTSPIAVQLDKLHINQLLLKTHADASPMQIDNVRISLNYFKQLNLQQLLIESGGLVLNAVGEADLAAPFEHDIKLTANHQHEAWVPELYGLSADVRSQGSLQALNVQVSSDGPLVVQVEADLQDLLDTPSWQLSLNSIDKPLSWPPDAGQAEIVVSQLALNSSGRLDDHKTELNAVFSSPEAISGQWQLSMAGDLEQLVIEQLSGVLLQGRIVGSGDYALQSETAEAYFSLQLQDIKPDIDQQELADLPGVSGTMEVRLIDNRVNLDQLNLRVPETDWRITGNGSYNLDNQQLDSTVNWQQLSWPPQTGSETQFSSQQGQLQLSGELMNLGVNLNTDIAGQAIPDIGLALDGRLQATAFDIQQLLLQTLDGQLVVNGGLDWANGLVWDVNMLAEQINPTVHWPDFPGSINLQATSTGKQTAQQLEAIIDIEQLEGLLRGQPVTGNGQLQYINGTIHSDGLQLRSGEAQLQIEGNEQALQVKLVVPELGDLLPAVSGSIQADISGQSIDGTAITATNMAVLTSINASHISWSNLQVDDLQLSGKTSTTHNDLLADMSLTASSLQLSEQMSLASLQINLNADNGQQQLRLQASHPEAELDLQLLGGFDQWPAVKQWQGNIEVLSIDNTHAGHWLLAQPAMLRLANDDWLLQQLCLNSVTTDNGSANICIDYQQHSEEQSKDQNNGQATINAHDIPLSLVEGWSNIGLRSNHKLSGDIAASWSQQLDSLDAEWQLSAGEIHFVDSDKPPLLVNGGSLAVTLLEQQILQSRLQLTVEDSNNISGDIRYGPIIADALGQEQLAGTIKLDMPSLAWLQKPIPQLDRIEGKLNLQATLSGPVRQPLVALYMALDNGQIDYQPVGLQLADIHLTGQSEVGQALQLTGGFSAGEGQATIQGSLDPGTRIAKLGITGEALQILDSEAIKVRISPDLQLAVSPEGYQINGELQIPSAQIKPPKGSTNRVTESEDVILVGADVERQVEAQTERQPIPINGQLRLVLGDEVSIDADIAETELSGELELLWANQLIPQVDGAINLNDGKVQAFGQTLILQDSRIVYNDAPADSPRLDIRAVRKIFGDPQVEEAGVAITGVAQQPNVQIFTNPATNEESALAYIATGSNFDHANGQGALNLGIYLFPKFFVSYGLGLFDNGNTANVRYEFSKSWNASMSSGSRDTGIDLNWRKDG